MNLEIILNYKEFVEWLKAGIDTPFKVQVNVPDEAIACTCKSHVPVSTCTLRTSSTSSMSGNVRNVPDVSSTEGESTSSGVYVLGEPLSCPLPKGTKDIPCFYRNASIVRVINAKGSSFKCCGAQDGFKCLTAIDETNKGILITASDTSFIESKNVQKMIAHFKDYECFLWCKENLYPIKPQSI